MMPRVNERIMYKDIISVTMKASCTLVMSYFKLNEKIYIAPYKTRDIGVIIKFKK